MIALLLVFLKAGFIGLAIAAPVGPIGILCIRKTLELGLYGALAVGLGAAFADSMYGLIAAAGLSTLSGFLVSHSGEIRVIGGLLLLCIAYKEEHSPIPSLGEHRAMQHKAFWRLVSEVVFLTLTNPLTIISYIGVFASIGSIGQCMLADIFATVLGVFCGALTWWMTLGFIITHVRGHLPSSWLRWIRYISAGIIATFGLCAIYSGLMAMFYVE